MTERSLDHLTEEDRKYIQDLREEAKTNRIRATTAESTLSEKVTALTAATQEVEQFRTQVTGLNEITTKYSTLQDEHAQTLAVNATTELKLLKIQAAIDAGLPHTFAERIQGASADEIKADALKFKEALPKTSGAVAFDRTRQEGGSVSVEAGLASFIASQISNGE